jgi:hypothetical protein
MKKVVSRRGVGKRGLTVDDLYDELPLAGRAIGHVKANKTVRIHRTGYHARADQLRRSTSR